MTDNSDLSTAQLVQRLSEETSTLVRQELRLAQLELTEKGKRAGIGVGMFGGAGVVALYGVGALIATAIAGLATALDHTWLAALIVSAALFAVAGILALVGKKEVGQATPPAPEQAIESTKRDVETVKEAAHR